MGNTQRTVIIHVTFKNTEATDALRAYATEKMSHCLKKFVHSDTEAHVTLRVEKLQQIAEINFHSDGKDFVGKEESLDLYASIDELSDSITQQLRKHKEKVTSHHK
jgi:putative sigma-54 modulation protein